MKKNHHIIDIICQFVASNIRDIEESKEMYCMILSQSTQPIITPRTKCVLLSFVTKVLFKEMNGQNTL